MGNVDAYGLYLVIGILAGMMATFLYCLHYILEHIGSSSQFYSNRVQDHMEQLEKMTQDFGEVTKKASEANLSLGNGMKDFEKKLRDIESRINMLSQRVKQ